MTDKRAYVRDRRHGPTRGHTCHWPGCRLKVAPASWGCYRHWMMLPRAIREEIWATFRPGQEITKTPSRDYVAAAQKAQEWIAENHPPIEAQGSLL